MKKALTLVLGIGLLGVVTFFWRVPVNAAPLLQPTPFPTPTPGSDGRILYTVQEGDTLYRIAAVAGMSLNELRQLNNRGTDDDVVIPGQVLLLGLAGPGLPTAQPGETPQDVTSLTPTPTLIMSSGEVCVLLYADVNGDAYRQETEMGILGGEVSVTAQFGGYSNKQPSKAGDPEVDDALTCFENVPPGSYIVTMAIPEGWNETTVLTKTIELTPGDTSYLNFGAQLSGLGRPQDAGDEGGDDSGRSPMLGLLGILLLLGGAGLGVYSMYSNQQRRSRGG